MANSLLEMIQKISDEIPEDRGHDGTKDCLDMLAGNICRSEKMFAKYLLDVLSSYMKKEKSKKRKQRIEEIIKEYGEINASDNSGR